MILGPFLVALAACLWATDSLFRYRIVQSGFHSLTLVLLEHTIALLLLIPFILSFHKDRFTKLTFKEWFGVTFIGVFCSAIATVLFTAAFAFGNPSVVILLQKLQPVFVLVFAVLFLKETITLLKCSLALFALLSSIVLSFPDLHFSFTREISSDSKAVLFSVTAAFIWAMGTLIGKSTLQKTTPFILTFWRYVFGFFVLCFITLSESFTIPRLNTLFENQLVVPLFYIALVSGLFAMVLYYNGLKRSTAIQTTFMELFFPISSLAINTFYLHQPLSTIQGIAAICLLTSVTTLSFIRN